MGNEKKKTPVLRIIRILIILLLAGIIVFAALVGMVCIREGKVPGNMAEVEKDYDAVIVLGAQVYADGRPSVQLSWRLDAAVQAWQSRPVPVVVCGAKGKDEPEPEAVVMKRYLAERGVPEESILTDPDSFNTEQNLEHARELLRTSYNGIRKVLVVTSDYHVPRSLALAKDLGLDAAGLGSPCKPEYWLKNHSREALAWCKYWLKKYLHLKI